MRLFLVIRKLGKVVVLGNFTAVKSLVRYPLSLKNTPSQLSIS